MAEGVRRCHAQVLCQTLCQWLREFSQFEIYNINWLIYENFQGGIAYLHTCHIYLTMSVMYLIMISTCIMYLQYIVYEATIFFRSQLRRSPCFVVMICCSSPHRFSVDLAATHFYHFLSTSQLAELCTSCDSVSMYCL